MPPHHSLERSLPCSSVESRAHIKVHMLVTDRGHAAMETAVLRHTNPFQYTLHFKETNSIRGSPFITKMHWNPSSPVKLFPAQTVWQEPSHVTNADLQTRDRDAGFDHVHHM